MIPTLFSNSIPLLKYTTILRVRLFRNVKRTNYNAGSYIYIYKVLKRLKIDEHVSSDLIKKTIESRYVCYDKA